MKKIIVAVAAACLLLSSCSGDACKCSYKDSEGNVTNVDPIKKGEDADCSKIAKSVEDKANAAFTLLGSDYKAKVTCKTVSLE